MPGETAAKLRHARDLRTRDATRRVDGTDELADFERRTFREWDPTSLGDLRRAIERRRASSTGLRVRKQAAHTTMSLSAPRTQP